jgi:hypothetical protein
VHPRSTLRATASQSCLSSDSRSKGQEIEPASAPGAEPDLLTSGCARFLVIEERQLAQLLPVAYDLAAHLVTTFAQELVRPLGSLVLPGTDFDAATSVVVCRQRSHLDGATSRDFPRWYLTSLSESFPLEALCGGLPRSAIFTLVPFSLTGSPYSPLPAASYTRSTVSDRARRPIFDRLDRKICLPPPADPGSGRPRGPKQPPAAGDHSRPYDRGPGRERRPREVLFVACANGVGVVYNTPTNASAYPNDCTTRKSSEVPASDPPACAASSAAARDGVHKWW